MPRRKTGEKEPTAIVVETPCFFTDETAEKAIDMLGGFESLNNIDRGKKTVLRMRLRPSDPQSHSIEAVAEDDKRSDGYKKRAKKTTRFVVRVNKKRTREGYHDAVVLGRVKKYFKFTRPADLQFLKLSGRGSAADESESERERVAALVPTDCRDMIKDGIQYFQRPSQMLPLPSHFFTFDAYRQEREVSSVSHVTKRMSSKDSKEQIDRVAEHFRRKPLWLATDMIKILASTSSSSVRISQHRLMKALLPKFATYIKNGAWGRAWCRNDFDPTKDVSSRKYQIFRLDLKSLLKDKSRERRNALSNAISESDTKFFLGAPLRMQNFYMLEDLVAHPDFTELNELPAPMRDEPDPKFGYYDNAFYDMILKELKIAFTQSSVGVSLIRDGCDDDDAGANEAQTFVVDSSRSRKRRKKILPPKKQRDAHDFYVEAFERGTETRPWEHLNITQRESYESMADRDEARYAREVGAYCKLMIPKYVEDMSDDEDDKGSSSDREDTKEQGGARASCETSDAAAQKSRTSDDDCVVASRAKPELPKRDGSPDAAPPARVAHARRLEKSQSTDSTYNGFCLVGGDPDLDEDSESTLSAD
eukprot:g1034.t1